MKRLPGMALLLAVLLLGGCGEEKEIQVSAAASLTGALQELAVLYEEESGVRVSLNLAGSGTLQKQIEQGAPVDVFVSASSAIMDGLEAGGHLREDTRRNLLSGELVFIVPDGRKESLEQVLTGDGLVALGDPEFVPAGRYGKNALETRGIPEIPQGRLLICKDVRQVLSYVESGEASGGFVFATDALSSDGVIVSERFTPEESGEILYPAALTRQGKNIPEAEDFLEWLSGVPAAGVFEKYGFTMIR